MVSLQSLGLAFPPKSILEIARADENGLCDGPRFIGWEGLFWLFRDGKWLYFGAVNQDAR